MEALKEFSIPLSGLKPGPHVYKFEVAGDFFKNFEGSPITEGTFEIDITLDRRSDMAILDFDIRGSYGCKCDRCLVDIMLPINHQDQIILKFEEGEDTDEVIFLDPHISEWNVANIIFEFICLSMPLTNIYDCKGIPCNKEVLKKLNQLEHLESEDQNTIWADLKNIKLN